MTDYDLRQLVQEADAAGAPAQPRGPRADDLLAALADRRRRRSRRRWMAACGAIVVALVAWRAADPRDGAIPAVVAHRTPAPAPDVDAVRTRLEQLDREAAMQLHIVHGLTDRSQIADSEFPSPESASADGEQYSQELARSAALSWRYALLVEQEFGDAAAARREYERVVARFPNTPWAQQAAQSLRRLPPPHDPQQL
jgi:hypothetical protein